MRKNQCIWLLVTFLIIIGGCGTEQNQSSKHLNPLLLISFDGFRYDYLSKTDTPHFDNFIAQGVQAEGLIPVFPTKTFPNHYSIATGLYPENSGLVGNSIYDPKFEEWYRIRDRDAVGSAKWYRGEPIWNTVEKQGLNAGTMFWVGSEAPVQGMRPTHWKPFDGNMPYRARIDTVVKWFSLADSTQIDFATLYFELMDKAGHEYGLESDSLVQAIRRSDELLGYLKNELQKEQLWDKMNIIIVSDHGMIDLSADKVIELDKIIDLDNVSRIVWAPVTMIQPTKGKMDTIYRALKTQQNHYRIYRKEDLPERYHYKNNRRVFDLIMVADLGYTILDQKYKSQFAESLPSATHGYDPDSRKMHAFFAARGPAFREGQKIGSFKNIHIYKLMTHLLNLEPAPNDGSLDSVKAMLKER